MKKYGREYIPPMTRAELYEKIIPNKTTVRITDGKNRNKKGTIVGVSRMYSGKYHRGVYQKYFSVRVDIGDRVVNTSCNYIKIMNQRRTK